MNIVDVGAVVMREHVVELRREIIHLEGIGEYSKRYSNKDERQSLCLTGEQQRNEQQQGREGGQKRERKDRREGWSGTYGSSTIRKNAYMIYGISDRIWQLFECSAA